MFPDNHSYWQYANLLLKAGRIIFSLTSEIRQEEGRNRFFCLIPATSDFTCKLRVDQVDEIKLVNSVEIIFDFIGLVLLL